MEKRLEDAERELSSLSADLTAAHKRLRRDAGASSADELRATARKGEEAALAQVREPSILAGQHCHHVNPWEEWSL